MSRTNLAKILDIADGAYGDAALAEGYDPETGEKTDRVNDLGDTLASFIIIEINETYDEEVPWREQVAEAYRVMQVARDELDDVLVALREEL